MYTLIDTICGFSSVLAAILLPIYKSPIYSLVGVVGYFVYPVILEPIYNAIALICSSNN